MKKEEWKGPMNIQYYRENTFDFADIFKISWDTRQNAVDHYLETATLNMLLWLCRPLFLRPKEFTASQLIYWWFKDPITKEIAQDHLEVHSLNVGIHFIVGNSFVPVKIFLPSRRCVPKYSKVEWLKFNVTKIPYWSSSSLDSSRFLDFFLFLSPT